MRIERQWIRVILILFSTLLLVAAFITLLTFGILSTSKSTLFNLIDEVESILNDKNHSENDSILKDLYIKDKEQYLEFKNFKEVITEVEPTNESNIYVKDIYLKKDSVSPFKEMITIDNPTINIESSIIDTSVSFESKNKVDLKVEDSIVHLHDIANMEGFEFEHIEITNSVFIIDDYIDNKPDIVDEIKMGGSLFVYSNVVEDGVSSKHYIGEQKDSSYLDKY